MCLLQTNEFRERILWSCINKTILFESSILIFYVFPIDHGDRNDIVITCGNGVQGRKPAVSENVYEIIH